MTMPGKTCCSSLQQQHNLGTALRSGTRRLPRWTPAGCVSSSGQGGSLMRDRAELAAPLEVCNLREKESGGPDSHSLNLQVQCCRA